MNVGTLTISLTARTASLAKAAANVKAFETGIVASVQRINASISSVGMAFSALTIPIAAIGIGSTKMFSEFEYNLHRITGLIGKSENQVKQWGKEVLGLAPKLGASANKMSESLYHIITSNPYRDSELNMELLEKSTKAAEAGLGDMESVARTAAYAMNAFGVANVDVSKAIDTIIFGVKEGVVTAEEYASALGKVLPAAQKVGMQFHEVAAATAAITRTGNNARESITQIRRMLFTLVQAPEKGKKALKEMNSSYTTLIKHIKDKGFLSVLQEIKNMSEIKGEDFLSDIFPNIRALLPVIDLLGENFKANVGIFERANTEIGGQLKTLWSSYTKTMRFAMKQIFSEAGVTAIEFGNQIKNVVVPIMTSLVKMVSSAANWFTNLRQEVKENVTKIILLSGAIGPLLILFSSLISVSINVVKLALIPLHLAFGVLKGAVILVLAPFVKFNKLLAASKAATLSHPIVLLAGALLSVVYALTKVKETSSLWYISLYKMFKQIEIWFLKFENWVFKHLEKPLLNATKLINSFLPSKLQIPEVEFELDIDSNLRKIEKLEDYIANLPQISFKDAGKSVLESMKEDLSGLTNWFVNQWDSMWKKMEPPAFSVPSGTFGPEAPVVPETFDEFIKRITSVREAINDFIYDPFESVDELIIDTYGSLAEMETHAKRVGSVFDLTGQSMKLIKDQIKEINEEMKKSGATDSQIKALNELQAKFNSLEMSTILSEMDMELKEVTRKVALFGDSWDVLNLKTEIYNSALRRLLNINTAAWDDTALQKYKEAVLNIINALNDIAKALDLQIQKMGYLSQIAQQFSSIATNLSNRRIAELEEQYKKESELVKNNTWQKIELEKQYQSKREQLMKKQAAFEKALGIFNVIINTAVGVMKYASDLATVPLIPWIIALGAAQVAAIASQPVPMKEGGIVPYGYSNDTYPALLSSGEMVIPPHKLPNFEFDFEKKNIEINLYGEWVMRGKDMFYIVKEEERKRKNVF